MKINHELKESVLDWAANKGLTHPSFVHSQFCKFCEELSEFSEEYNRESYYDKAIYSEAGDVIVTLIIVSQNLGIDINECFDSEDWNNTSFICLTGYLGGAILKQNYSAFMYNVRSVLLKIESLLHSKNLGSNLDVCLKLAYDKIKNRTGKKVNGVFVKTEDIPE